MNIFGSLLPKTHSAVYQVPVYQVYQVYQEYQVDQDQISGATYISDVVFLGNGQTHQRHSDREKDGKTLRGNLAGASQVPQLTLVQKQMNEFKWNRAVCTGMLHVRQVNLPRDV